MSSLKQDLAQSGGAQALPASVVAGTIMGMPINTVILWLTLLYLIIQILVIMPKARTALREWKRGKHDKCE